jgi:hypothetical protein
VLIIGRVLVEDDSDPTTAYTLEKQIQLAPWRLICRDFTALDGLRPANALASDDPLRWVVAMPCIRITRKLNIGPRERGFGSLTVQIADIRVERGF